MDIETDRYLRVCTWLEIETEVEIDGTGIGIDIER